MRRCSISILLDSTRSISEAYERIVEDCPEHDTKLLIALSPCPWCVLCASKLRCQHSTTRAYRTTDVVFAFLLCNMHNGCEQIMNSVHFVKFCCLFVHFCLSVYTHNPPWVMENSVAILDSNPFLKNSLEKLQSFYIKKCSVHILLTYLFVYFYYIFYYTFLYILYIFIYYIYLSKLYFSDLNR